MGPLLLLLAVYVLVRAWYLDFVPLWDGVVYYHGAKAALGTLGATGSVIATEVHGHVSFLWLLLLSAPTLVDIERIVLFNAWHTLLAMLSIAAFHGILATAAGSRATSWELAWWSALFAFHPVVIANWLNPNLDSGLMLFLVLYLYGWLRRRYLLATAAALGIIFTKEPGLLLFPLVPLGVLLALPDRRGDVRQWACRVALLLPPSAFGVYAIAKTQLAGLPLFWTGMTDWQGMTTLDMLLRIFDPLHFDRMTATQLVHAFILNGQWLATLVFAAAAVAFFRVHPRRRPADEARGLVIALAVVSLLVLYAVTRFGPHDNARYVLPFIACLLLLGASLVIHVLPRPRFRFVVAGLLVLVSVAGSFRTIDPLSAWLFGTFRFGEHRMLKMASIAHGCCGYGRDQLVYNLQYVNFHYLQNPMYRRIRPREDTVFIQAQDTLWTLGLPLETSTWNRTMKWTGVFTPRYTSIDEFEARYGDAARVYYIEYPSADNRDELERLTALFPHRQRFTVRDRGYELPYWLFSRTDP